MTRRMFTVREAAEVLRVSRSHLYRLAREGEIPHRRFGDRVLFPAEVIDDLCSAPAIPSPTAVAALPPAQDEPVGGGFGVAEPTQPSLGEVPRRITSDSAALDGASATPTTQKRRGAVTASGAS